MKGTSAGLRVLLLLSALLGAAAIAAPAAPVPPLADYFQERWRTAEGLPHNLVNRIVQTPDGYLWFATWEGLARFNGREFTVFDREQLPQLPDAGVRALHVDAGGALWIGGSRGGLAKLEDGRWTFFDPAASLIYDLLRDRKARLWIATERSGIERIDPDGTRHWFGRANGLPSDATYSLAEASDGRIWVGTSRGLGWVKENQAGKATQPGLPEAPMFALQVDHEGRLLVGSEHGAFVADGERFVSLHEQLAGQPVISLRRDADGETWIGTINLGLLRLGANGLERLGVEHGLPNSRVQSLLQDREGNTWVGTNGGLVRLRIAPFKSYGREAGLSDDYVRAVLRHSDGSLWIGTSNGLNRMDAAGVHPVVAMARSSVLSLAEGENGEVWVGTYADGLYRLAGQRVVAHLRREDGLGSNEVRVVLRARDGGVWAGTALGVTRIGAAPPSTLRAADGLPGEFVIALHEAADGALWIGTANGAAQLRDGVLQALDLAPLDHAEFVFGFHEDVAGNAMWMATDRGLIRYRAGELDHVPRSAGLPFEKLFNITADYHGAFWIGSNRGVLRIDRSALEAVADGRAERLAVDLFGEADGMRSAQCNGGAGPAVAIRDDGSIWFGTAGGVTTVQPARLGEHATTPPPVVIEAFRSDGRPRGLEQGQRLPAGTGRVELSFAGLGYVLTHRIRYRTRLDGFDTEWVERGQHTAEFTNLGPGDYRFRVVAAQPGGGWSPQEATLAFSIAPFLWQRPLAWVAAGLLALLLVFAAYRYRLRRLRRSERRLRELVELRTLDLSRQTDRLIAADAEKTALLGRLREQSEAFERQAREDALTGLLNRRAFDEELAREFIRAGRSGQPLSLALLDIDYFKQVNDDWSHATGDEVLRCIARLMRSQCREIDLIARWGGEEFALLFPHTALPDARLVSERLRAAIEAFDWSRIEPGLALTASIGVAAHQDLAHHERLVSRADEALYRAKQAGRNRVCV